MRGSEFLDKMELIDPVYVDAAVHPPKKEKPWIKWCVMAACLCLIVGTIAAHQHFLSGPQLPEIILSEKSTVQVSYGYEEGTVGASKDSIAYLSEEELFSQEKMYAFRGTVNALANITIDYNGEKDARCIATIEIEEVYQGDIIAGEQITMLLPCVIADGGSNTEDTGIISRLRTGMEGIFISRIYDENSYIQMNGATLMLLDIAECGLMDGMRWVFIDTGSSIVFDKNAYPGAKNAKDLDDIEAYVTNMLK